MKIVVLDGHALNPGDLGWDELAELGELMVHDRTALAMILERARGAEILLTNKTPISADLIAQLDRLKFIGVLATGYNVVDVPAARSRGITVSNVPEYSTQTVAQFTFALLLELCHRVGMHGESVKRGDWTRCADFSYCLTPQVELAGRTMGIIGFGKIGRAVGRLANAFGMKVLANARHQDRPPDYSPFRWGSLEEVFAESDVVSLHCPQTSATSGMVNTALLSTMKRTAFLINTARGGLVDEADLADALNNGRLAAAAVDVVSAEPIQAGNPLLNAKNCLITPHIAWTTLEARKRVMHTAAMNVRAFLSGKPINVVGG